MYKYKPGVIITSTLALLTLIYLIYALLINQVSYTPEYQLNNKVKSDPADLSSISYPYSFRVYGTEVEINNSAQQQPMASTAKLVTALALINKIGEQNLNTNITLTKKDVDITTKYQAIDGSVVAFNAGQQVSYKKALEYSLVVSANNFTDILVTRQFASQQEFINYANKWLEEKGLANTKLADATGFSPNTITTPYDLTLIGNLAIQNDTIKEIVKIKQTTLPDGSQKDSTNLFLDTTYGNVSGIKTGNTKEAGFVYLTSVDAKDRPTLVAAIMQAPDRLTSQEQAIKLVNLLGSTYKDQTVFAKNNPVIKVNLPWQKGVGIYTNKDAVLKNIANQDVSYSINLNNFNKSTKAGDLIGRINIASVIDKQAYDLILGDDYSGISPIWLLTNPGF